MNAVGQLQMLAQHSLRFGQSGWQALSAAGQAAILRCAASPWCASLPLMAAAVSYVNSAQFAANQPSLADQIPTGYGAGGLPNGVAGNTGNQNHTPNYAGNTVVQIPDLGLDGNIVGGGFGSGTLPPPSNIVHAEPPPSILDDRGQLPVGIGGVGTPIPMPSSENPNQTAEDFARNAFNGQVPLSIEAVGDGWLAKLPNGTSVLYRPAGQATRTDPSTASVDVNNLGVRALNRGAPAKFKFPKS
jgi:hypothetical protein